MMDNLPDSHHHALLVKIYETWELYLGGGGGGYSVLVIMLSCAGLCE